MHTYPADERRISEVERGRSREAVVPMPPEGSIAVGDTVLFALCRSRGGQPPTLVIGGDSVLVSVTGVTELGEVDPETGRAMVRLAWEPLGQGGPPIMAPDRALKTRRTPGRG